MSKGLSLRRRAPLLFIFSIVLSSAPLLSAEDKPTQQQRAAMEQIVRDYILQHPEIIAQAANLYQDRERKSHQEKVKEDIAAKSKELQEDPTSPVAGKGGGVTVVEFFDYHCSYCRRAEPTVEQLLKTHPEMRLVFKELPILGPASTLAAKASLAANEQGAYLPFHQALMTHSGTLDMQTIEDLASKNRLDVSKLKADMESPNIASRLAANAELARSVGVTGTPTFVVGSQIVQGAIDEALLSRLIADVRATSSHLASTAR